ncbi:MAG: tetratricopeptide repeat protein, partial [Desulfobulbaceae bacterium]|nr:tetratricopeptide repeat protein [Desulfobulbaceae bacterium]
KGLLDESIEDCNKALQIDENHFFALNNRGRAFQKKGDIPSALKDYDAACQKGLEVACENFKKITRLSPHKEIAFLLGKSREDVAKGDSDGVIDASTRLIALNVHTKEAYSKRCSAYVRKNMFNMAHSDCAEAILLDPDEPINYINLGVVFEQQGDIKAALQNYRISCELENEAGCRKYKRLTTGAEEVASPVAMEEVEETLPEVDVAALLEKSREEFVRKDYDAVIDISTQIIQADPENVEAYSNRCGARAIKNQYQEAHDDCVKAIAIDPAFAMSYNNLGWVFEQQRAKDEALDQYNRSCQLQNTLGCQNYERLVAEQVDVVTLLEQSREGFAREDYDAVIGLSTQIIQADPENAEAYSNRCGARAIKNQYQEAHDDCVKAIAIDPAFAMSYNNLGWVFEQQGDVEAALANYNKSCQLENALGCQNYQRLLDKP